MNWYPQIGSGAITQFPLIRSRSWRAIRNELESGEQIVLADAPAGEIAWGLSYKELSDTEAQVLNDLYTGSQGSYGAFGFVDPLANLLGWSEDLTQPDWQLGLLTQTSGIADPTGGHQAIALVNSSPGTQQLSQTVSLPGTYGTCFSVWLRSDSPLQVTLLRDGMRAAAVTGNVWRRCFLSGTSGVAGVGSTFSLELNAGQTVELWGMQVEAQPYPSGYKATSAAAGIYPETYFAEDELTITSTGPGLSSCDIKLISRV